MAYTSSAIAWVALSVVACSGAGGGFGFDNGGEDPPPYFAAPDGIACGERRCGPGAVCIAAGGEMRCAPPGAEMNARLPTLVMECDGREDCAPGERCMAVTGHWEMFQCLERCDGYAAASVCTSDADCERCDRLASDVEVHCRPHPTVGRLSVCTAR